jgi:5'-nucleotidase
MRILVTNDDGIHAPGLAVAEALAARFSDDVWVVAPADEQSGAGHSLTLTRPLRVRHDGARRFAVSGTPTDCVMMALLELLDRPPDLLISGVNRGANLAEDVTYSGTVAAAIEGALAGFRSIALSQVRGDSDDESRRFAVAEAWAERAVRPLVDRPFAPGTLVNVNFPAGAPEAVRGIRVTTQGRRDYGRARTVRHTDPRGFPYYWLSLGPAQGTPGHASDLKAIADNHVAVTPLQLDLTHAAGMAALAELYG